MNNIPMHAISKAFELFCTFPDENDGNTEIMLLIDLAPDHVLLRTCASRNYEGTVLHRVAAGGMAVLDSAVGHSISWTHRPGGDAYHTPGHSLAPRPSTSAMDVHKLHTHRPWLL